MKLLYIAFNNGTDARIAKELLHLSERFELYFIGLGLVVDLDYIPNNVKSYKINFNHKSIFGIMLLNLYIIFARLWFGIKNVYIVDEQCYFVTWPTLLGMKKILDIFDSFFLKINMQSNKLMFAKKIIYGSVDMLIITDKYRKELLPEIHQKKATIYPNYPSSSSIKSSQIKSDFNIKNINIGLFGSISKDRGAEIARRLLDVDSNIQLIMGGWLYDDYAKNLSQSDRVKYVGILPQKKILQIMASEINLLLAYYPNFNINNKYASPNKLYDAILTSVPILINSYPMVSEVVRNMNIGLVLDDFETDSQVISKFRENYFDFISSFERLNKFEYTDESVSLSYLNSVASIYNKIPNQKT
jgi:hypothetical protein